MINKLIFPSIKTNKDNTMKYELVKDQTYNIGIIVLYRIRALRDFNDVKKGDIGGYVESEHNLCQYGDCWIYNNAKVYNKAKVIGDVKILNSVHIYESAYLYGNVEVSDYSIVKGNAIVSDFSKISNSAHIMDNARITGRSIIKNYAKIKGNAYVQSAEVSDEACIENILYSGAKVSQNMNLKFSRCSIDLSLKENLGENIRCQTNLPIFLDEQGKYVLGYKHVKKTFVRNIFSSGHDPHFSYKLNEWAEVKEPDLSNKSCAPGLHFSHLSYWEESGCNTVIQIKCYLDDIITVQDGKIRCKKLLPLAVVENSHE